MLKKCLKTCCFQFRSEKNVHCDHGIACCRFRCKYCSIVKFSNFVTHSVRSLSNWGNKIQRFMGLSLHQSRTFQNFISLFPNLAKDTFLMIVTTQQWGSTTLRLKFSPSTAIDEISRSNTFHVQFFTFYTILSIVWKSLVEIPFSTVKM